MYVSNMYMFSEYPLWCLVLLSCFSNWIEDKTLFALEVELEVQILEKDYNVPRMLLRKPS